MPTETVPGNSHVARKARAEGAEEKDVKPVVTGKVVRRKQPWHKKLVRTFVGEEGATGVVDYVVNDLIVPATKELIVDAATSTVERIFLGESPRGPRRHRHSSGGRVDYAGISSRTMRRDEPRAQMSDRGRMMHNFDDIVLDSRAEVDAVLEDMYELLEKFDAVTVADLYRLLNQTPSFTDTKYGWEGPGALSGARAARLPRGGYLIDLPRPQELRD